MKSRDLYLSQLLLYKNKPLIKVITGIRRCGKSTLLSLFENHLLSTGVPKNRIIRMNFESLTFDHIKTYKEMYDDIKGKQFLKTLEKYYMVDMGIRNQLTGLRDTNYGHVLENIIYLELIRQGYEVTIGKIGSLEVDFVAKKTDEIIYYQVSATILDKKTREGELRPLQKISDNYPKVLLTMDQSIFNDYSGIKVQNIIDFLTV